MDAVTARFAPYPAEVRELAMRARELMRELLPDAAEEIDTKPPLLGYTYRPGTYKGLILAIMPQKGYVNVVFSKGVELLELDSAGLPEGTGQVARHVKGQGAGLPHPPPHSAARPAAPPPGPPPRKRSFP